MIMKFAGTWHINKMELWNEDFFNMEVQAYVTVDEGGGGDFQFGLVSGQIDCEVVKNKSGERFEFTWDGNDECDEAAGSGWLQFQDDNSLEGNIKFHGGDRSLFWATRV
jgi:hypothetical protein